MIYTYWKRLKNESLILKENKHISPIFLFLFYAFFFSIFTIIISPGIRSIGVYSFCLFSNNVCLSMCKLIFAVKDFSGTTAPRILKFDANIGYDLYCARQNQHPCAYHSIYLSIFLFLQLLLFFFIKDFWGTTAPRILYKHWVWLCYIV